MTLSLYQLGMNLFLYCEFIGEVISPCHLFPALESLLEIRPDEWGGTTWIPMEDIFHFSQPVNVEHWRRKERVEKRVGMVARIKAGMLSSYIYHHYVLQESQSFIANKYCMIALDGTLIFYYEEQPVISELRQGEGKIGTHAMSADWMDTWQEIMEPHFLDWDGVNESEMHLRPCEIILECSQDSATQGSRRDV
jgi:hypothetical protein